MIRDTEENSGLLPVPPMDGEALPTESDELVGGERQTTGGAETCKVEVALCEGATGNVWDKSELGIAHSESALAQGECQQRVGYTIDMSVDLGNLSHFDVHDVSYCFGVRTEEVPGRVENWFFVLPNEHGLKQPESNHQCVFIAKPLLAFSFLLLCPNGKDATEICCVHCK